MEPVKSIKVCNAFIPLLLVQPKICGTPGPYICIIFALTYWLFIALIMEAAGCCETYFLFIENCNVTSQKFVVIIVCFLRLLDKVSTLQQTGTEIQNVIYKKEENDRTMACSRKL